VVTVKKQLLIGCVVQLQNEICTFTSYSFGTFGALGSRWREMDPHTMLSYEKPDRWKTKAIGQRSCVLPPRVENGLIKCFLRLFMLRIRRTCIVTSHSGLNNEHRSVCDIMHTYSAIVIALHCVWRAPSERALKRSFHWDEIHTCPAKGINVWQMKKKYTDVLFFSRRQMLRSFTSPFIIIRLGYRPRHTKPDKQGCRYNLQEHDAFVGTQSTCTE